MSATEIITLAFFEKSARHCIYNLITCIYSRCVRNLLKILYSSRWLNGNCKSWLFCEKSANYCFIDSRPQSRKNRRPCARTSQHPSIHLLGQPGQIVQQRTALVATSLPNLADKKWKDELKITLIVLHFKCWQIRSHYPEHLASIHSNSLGRSVAWDVL